MNKLILKQWIILCSLVRLSFMNIDENITRHSVIFFQFFFFLMNKNWNTNPVNWPVISYSNIPKLRHFPSLQKMALSLSGFLRSLWFAQRAHARGLCGTLVLPDKRRRLAGEPEVIQLGGYSDRDISSPLERAPRSATGTHTGAAHTHGITERRVAAN